MAEKSNYPTQPQQLGMYYPCICNNSLGCTVCRTQGPAPNSNVPMYPANNMNQMSAPPTYDQAIAQPSVQPR